MCVCPSVSCVIISNGYVINLPQIFWPKSHTKNTNDEIHPTAPTQYEKDINSIKRQLSPEMTQTRAKKQQKKNNNC